MQNDIFFLGDCSVSYPLLRKNPPNNMRGITRGTARARAMFRLFEMHDIM